MTIFNDMTAIAQMRRARRTVATIVRQGPSWVVGPHLGNQQQCGRGFAPGGAD